MPYQETRLWNLLKSLKSSSREIHLEHLSVDFSKLPKTYMVIQDQVFDESTIHGDGSNLVRTADYELYINSTKKSNARSFLNDVIAILDSNNIEYQLNGNTYDPNSKYYTFSIGGSIIYNV
ncbi:MAG: hypothetical protein ABII85_01830 [Bacillota bacterium]